MKTLLWDTLALNALDISRTTASYKLKYGLSKSIKYEQIIELKNSMFLLSADESTNKAFESILAILVCYFSDEQKKVVSRHSGLPLGPFFHY